MDLKTIANFALEEAGMNAADAPKTLPISVKENSDGTMTYSVLVSFDPKVQEEMSAAMPKGTEREDLADELGVFSSALDELVEDAGGRRYTQTPIENCRAKDPLFCPYHGEAVMRKAIADEMSRVNIPFQQVSLDFKKQKNGYLVSMTVPKSLAMTQFQAGMILTEPFSDIHGSLKKGVTLTPPDGSQGLVTEETNASGDTKFTTMAGLNPDEDISVAKLDEWIDGLITDIAADPTLQNDLDPQDVRLFLNAREDFERTPTTDPNYKNELKELQDAYHSVRAQIDFRHVKSVADAHKEEMALENEYGPMYAEFQNEKYPVDAAKAVLFPKGRFPNGFGKAHKWAADYSAAASNVGWRAQSLWDDAKKEWANAQPGALKSYRAALGKLKYAVEVYKEALDDYKKAVPKFMDDFKDWAMNDPNVQPSQFKAAFPNSNKPPQPTQAQTQQTSTPKGIASPNGWAAQAPQSWDNYVMGYNRILPTDTLADLPYGKERGFSNVMDYYFRGMSADRIFRKFYVNPANGAVTYTFSSALGITDDPNDAKSIQGIEGALKVNGYNCSATQNHINPGEFDLTIPFDPVLAQ